MSVEIDLALKICGGVSHPFRNNFKKRVLRLALLAQKDGARHGAGR
jgi:hypothetical protein